MSRILISMLLVCSFSATTFTFAQTGLTFRLETNPEFPQPNTSVTISIKTNSFDPRTTGTTWFVDGVRVANGTGITQIPVEMGSVGTTRSIRAQITLSNGEIIEQSINIQPASITLIWEAVDSFVPPFYPGKRLMAAEGTVRIVAIPDSNTYSRGMVYTWKRNGVLMPNLSGFGKNSAVMKNNFFDQQLHVSVIAASPDGSFRSEGSISIPRTTPYLLLRTISNTGVIRYENLSGVVHADGSAADIELFPMHMSSRDGSRFLSTDWTINGTEFNPDTNESDRIIRIGNPGTSLPISIKITAQHTKNLLQELTTTKQLIFD